MDGSEAAEEYPWRLTFYVGVCWILTACSGLMFGYDIGISGGVIGMDDFLEKFFPSVHRNKLVAHENNYCKFDNQFLQLFTSSLYLSALFSSFVASKYCSTFGHKSTIIAASLFFLSSTLLSALSSRLWMVIIGRVIMGVGVGFGNEDDEIAWWVDSGATTHVCMDKSMFKIFVPLDDGRVLHMGNESNVPVLGKGLVELEFSFGKTLF